MEVKAHICPIINWLWLLPLMLCLLFCIFFYFFFYFFFIIKNGPSTASFSFIFVLSNKHYNFYNKYMWKNVRPSSIRRWDSNPWPLEHESPTITTRPNHVLLIWRSAVQWSFLLQWAFSGVPIVRLVQTCVICMHKHSKIENSLTDHILRGR